MTAPAIDRPAVLEQLDLYNDAAANHAARGAEIARLKAEVAMVKDTLETIEAEVIVNGGHGTYLVTGSNAEARKAAVAVALANHFGYQTQLSQLRKTEGELAYAEAVRDDDANTMRGARLAIEYATSENYRLAAAEGGPEVRRNGNHG